VTERIEDIGGLTLPAFDQKLRRITYELATQARTDIRQSFIPGITRACITSSDDTPDGDFTERLGYTIRELFVELADHRLPQGIELLGEKGRVYRKSEASRPVTVVINPIDGSHRLKCALDNNRIPTAGKVAVTISVLVDGVAIASYMCDISTLVLYACPPYGKEVLRIDEDGMRTGTGVDMATLPHVRSLSHGTLLWHKPPPHEQDQFGSPLTTELISDHTIFKRVVRPEGGSIGLYTSRVMSQKRIVALLRSAGSMSTPGSDGPMQAWANARRLTILQIRKGHFKEVTIPLRGPIRNEYDLLYIRPAHIPDLRQYGRVERLSR